MSGGDEFVDRRPHARMIQRDHRDSLVAFAGVLEGLGQSVGIEHVGFDDIDQRASRRQRRPQSADVVDDLGHEDILVARHDEAEAMAAPARQVGRRRIRLKTETFDRLLDATNCRFLHAAAAVQNAIDRGCRDARFPGDVLQHDRGGIDRVAHS